MSQEYFEKCPICEEDWVSLHFYNSCPCGLILYRYHVTAKVIAFSKELDKYRLIWHVIGYCKISISSTYQVIKKFPEGMIPFDITEDKLRTLILFI